MMGHNINVPLMQSYNCIVAMSSPHRLVVHTGKEASDQKPSRLHKGEKKGIECLYWSPID